jgi:hypothetical protein
MTTCLFLSFRTAATPSTVESSKLDALVRTTPKLAKGLLHAAASASDPYIKDGPAPSLVLQLYFTELPDLENALSPRGHLAALASSAEFPTLAHAEIAHQAMFVRPFAVPESAFETPRGEPHCTYLVSYEGEAEDLNAWHAHYFGSHIRHMAEFPGIRELEIYTRVDWVSLLPWTRQNFMQRNKVVFDSTDALQSALHSPVRHAMRDDFKRFPKFTGPNNHFAMATHVVRPQ